MATLTARCTSVSFSRSIGDHKKKKSYYCYVRALDRKNGAVEPGDAGVAGEACEATGGGDARGGGRRGVWRIPGGLACDPLDPPGDSLDTLGGHVGHRLGMCRGLYRGRCLGTGRRKRVDKRGLC